MPHASRRMPPQSPPSFDVSPDALVRETEQLIATTQALHDALAADLSPASATYSSAVLPILRDDIAAARRLCVFRTLSSVAPDPALRDASRAADRLASRAHAESLLRPDVAALVAAVWARHCSGEDPVPDPEDAYALFKTHREYQHAGAGLGDADLRRAYLEAVDERNEVLLAARKTLTEADEGVWFSKGQLEGVPPSILDTMKQQQEQPDDNDNDNDDKTKPGELLYRVTFQKSHFFPVMKHAVRAATRKALFRAKERRFPENVSRLERAVELRTRIARLLGFATHADLRIEDKMATSVAAVVARLHRLRDELRPLAEGEMHVLLELKQAGRRQRQAAAAAAKRSSKAGQADEAGDQNGEEAGDEDEQDASRINPWDWGFYARVLEKERYAVDALLVSEYFEINHSLAGMLSIFESLFGMAFVRAEHAPTWQDDVCVYEAWDTDDRGAAFLGYLYLDLYARDGKYSGAHSSLIQPGFVSEHDGTRHCPSSSLICSIVRSPEAGSPTLLQHSELKTMFHELGHAIHKLVTRTRLPHGCARDFVEIPSILLENWIWVSSVLRRLGRHYSYLAPHWEDLWRKRNAAVATTPPTTATAPPPAASPATTPAEQRPPEMLPVRLVDDLARTKHVNAAHTMLHQVFLALFDLSIHSAPSPEAARDIDTTSLWNTTKAEIVGLGATDGFGQASFAHPFRAYDASYFTYALSKVYATDLWISSFKADPMDRETGLRYRKAVLEPGGSQPELKSLINFLGREPNDEAYYHEIAGTSASTL